MVDGEWGMGRARTMTPKGTTDDGTASRSLLRVREAAATPIGMRLPADRTSEEWLSFGRSLAKVDDAKQWLAGDWWNEGQKNGFAEGPTGVKACEQAGI